MTSTDTHLAAATPAHTLATVDWLMTADHKKVGRLFIGAGLVSLVGGLVIATLVGFERIGAEGLQVLTENSATQVIAVARVLLTFGAVLPILLGLAVAIVPLQIGSRSIAYPRLAAGGFWMWLTGLGLVVASIMGNGGPGGGSSEMVDLYLAASIVMALGVLMTAVSIATTMLTSRAPGMGLLRAPLFAWSSFVGAIALALTIPVLIGTTLYLYVDHRYARAGFGGNVGINSWIGWALSQPFTYLLAIPALGIVLDIVPVMGGTHLARRPVAPAAVTLVALAVLPVVTQSSVTLPWEGDSFLGDTADKIVDVLPFLLMTVLPVLGLLGVLGVSMLTLKSGRPKAAAPLAFAVLGLIALLEGAAAHILNSVEDAGLVGSIFEAGAYVAVTFGTVLVAFAGIAYWGPKLWGRRIADRAALPLALLGFVATALVSLPYMVAGFADQPAGAIGGFSYSGPQELWNILATAGFAMMLLTTLAFVLLALKGFTGGEPAGDDPWDGATLEWATSSPPPAHNFADVAVVNSPTPLTDMKDR